MPNKIVYVPAETGQAYWGPGDRYTFLITGDESGGSYFTMEALVPPGGGPPPHIHHREEEQFYILAGELTLKAGDQTIQASVGDFVHIPRGTVHAFRNTGQVPAKLLITYSPAGIEKLFQQVFEPAGDRTAPPPPWTNETFARFKAIESEYGLETVLPAGPASDC
jgi:mannose-6-phosphate isomerase-like protein (cupin superfamily)